MKTTNTLFAIITATILLSCVGAQAQYVHSWHGVQQEFRINQTAQDATSAVYFYGEPSAATTASAVYSPTDDELTFSMDVAISGDLDITGTLSGVAEADGTTSETFTIDKDNTGAGASSLKLIFNRGTTGSDASLEWDETGDEIKLNFTTDITGGLDISGQLEAGSGNHTLTNAAGLIDGEKIQDDTIDDDSIDFSDVTFEDFSGAVTATSASFGGGYTNTGVTISSAGAINADGALTVDGASSLQSVTAASFSGDGSSLTGITVDKNEINNSGTLGFDWGDGEVADTITASNYLPLAGGTLTGDLRINSGEHIYLGDDQDEQDHFIYFEDAEYFGWDESENNFVLTNSLDVESGININDKVILYSDGNFQTYSTNYFRGDVVVGFGSGGPTLSWDSTDSELDIDKDINLNADLNVNGDNLWLGDDGNFKINVGALEDSKNIEWTNSTQKWDIHGDTKIYGNLSMSDDNFTIQGSPDSVVLSNGSGDLDVNTNLTLASGKVLTAPGGVVTYYEDSVSWSGPSSPADGTIAVDGYNGYFRWYDGGWNYVYDFSCPEFQFPTSTDSYGGIVWGRKRAFLEGANSYPKRYTEEASIPTDATQVFISSAKIEKLFLDGFGEWTATYFDTATGQITSEATAAFNINDCQWLYATTVEEATYSYKVYGYYPLSATEETRLGSIDETYLVMDGAEEPKRLMLDVPEFDGDPVAIRFRVNGWFGQRKLREE